MGGGLKKTWLWVDLMRRGPTEGPPVVERVIRIMNSDCHTAKVALVGHGNTLRYILATENLKVGDLIKTSGEIPRNPGESFFSTGQDLQLVEFSQSERRRRLPSRCLAHRHDRQLRRRLSRSRSEVRSQRRHLRHVDEAHRQSMHSAIANETRNLHTGTVHGHRGSSVERGTQRVHLRQSGC